LMRAFLPAAGLLGAALVLLWALRWFWRFLAIGASYKSKILCITIFGSGRNVDPNAAEEVSSDAYWFLNLFRARVDRVTELEAHIDIFEAGRRMRLIYLPTPSLPRASSVLTDDLIIEGVPGGTVVRILGSGVPGAPEWDTQYWRMRTSWHQALNRLKVYVEKKAEAGTAA